MFPLIACVIMLHMVLNKSNVKSIFPSKFWLMPHRVRDIKFVFQNTEKLFRVSLSICFFLKISKPTPTKMTGHFIDFSARVSLLLALMLLRSNAADDSCRTVSGPDTGSPCMFPFIWEGVTYTSCVASDDENSTSTWCDTRVDATSASG